MIKNKLFAIIIDKIFLCQPSISSSPSGAKAWLKDVVIQVDEKSGKTKPTRRINSSASLDTGRSQRPNSAGRKVRKSKRNSTGKKLFILGNDPQLNFVAIIYSEC